MLKKMLMIIMIQIWIVGNLTYAGDGGGGVMYYSYNDINFYDRLNNQIKDAVKYCLLNYKNVYPQYVDDCVEYELDRIFDSEEVFKGDGGGAAFGG